MQIFRPRGAAEPPALDGRTTDTNGRTVGQSAAVQAKPIKALAIVCALSALSLAIVWIMVWLGGGNAAVAIEKLGVKTKLDGTASPRAQVLRLSGLASVSFRMAGKVARGNFNERRPPCRHYVHG